MNRISYRENENVYVHARLCGKSVHEGMCMHACVMGVCVDMHACVTCVCLHIWYVCGHAYVVCMRVCARIRECMRACVWLAHVQAC